MVEKIKLAIRVSGEALNDEILDCINACYADMNRVGIVVYNNEKNVLENKEKDPLIIQCQKLHARWHFNFENQAERYEKAYCAMRDAISLDGDYNV